MGVYGLGFSVVVLERSFDLGGDVGVGSCLLWVL